MSDLIEKARHQSHVIWNTQHEHTTARRLLQELAAALEVTEAKCVELEKLLMECLNMANNWPGIAYSYDLEQRCRAALPQPSDTQRDE